MFHPIIIFGVLLSERSEGSGEAATCKLQNLIQAALCKMHNPAFSCIKPKGSWDWDLEQAERAPLPASGHSLACLIPSTGVSAGPMPLVAIAAGHGDHESTFEVMWVLPSHPSSMPGPGVQSFGHEEGWGYGLIRRRTQIKRSSWPAPPPAPAWIYSSTGNDGRE